MILSNVIDGLWFIDLFSSVGEKVVIIEDDFDKTLAKLLD